MRTCGDQHVEQDLAKKLSGATTAQLGGGQVGHGNMSAWLDRNRYFGKKFARVDTGQPAEIAACGAVNANRYDGGTGLGGDEGCAVIHFHQRAGFGNSAFRKDHHRLSGFHQLDDLLHRQRAG